MNDKYFNVIRLYILFGIIICYSSACNSLSPIKTIYKGAFLAESEKNWQINQQTLGDQSITDLFTNGTISIELCFLKDKEKSFVIQTKFSEASGNLIFIPSNATIKFNNGEILKAEITSCTYYTNHSIARQGTRIDSPLQDKIPINKNACYYLTVDHPAPPIEEEIILDLSNSLAYDDEKINVPPIYFRKTVKSVYRWGLFQ